MPVEWNRGKDARPERLGSEIETKRREGERKRETAVKAMHPGFTS